MLQMLLFNVVECERGIVRHVIATVFEHCAQDGVALIKLGRGGNHIGRGVQECEKLWNRNSRDTQRQVGMS